MFSLLQDGFAIARELLSSAEIISLIADLDALPVQEGVRNRDGVYAVRNLLAHVPAIDSLARSEKVRPLIESALAAPGFPVRAILFDKTPGANWLVPWHQDLTIAVQEKREVSGYGPWTVKAGVWHVQPPVSILEGMVSIRIHLDDCAEANGALRVLAGSHVHGRLRQEQIRDLQLRSEEAVCDARAGDALLMKPLLLHASSPAAVASHRRVIHIDFATRKLDHGLLWATE